MSRLRSKPRRLRLEYLESRQLLSTFTVTDTSDDVNDPGSLRFALTQSNLSGPGPNLIQFDIPGSGVQTIAPATPLPASTVSVTIDGSGQTGFAGTPLIVLDGTNAGLGVDGLTLNGVASTVQSLAIDNFDGNGLVINGAGSVVVGCYLGVDATGSTAASNGGDGILITAANATIGGTAAAARNVISSNDLRGIEFSGGGTGSLVQGNYIGTDFSGTAPLGNHLEGICLSGPSGVTIGGTDPNAGNLISGNLDDGVCLETGGNTVQGNLIGTDFTGTANLGNGGNGVMISPGADGNIVGGSAPGAGNIIAFNAGNGVLVSGSVTNLISQNSIFENGSAGISLINNGNNDQPAPVLTSFTAQPNGSTLIEGTLTAAASTTFTLEFFASSTNTQPGGETFLTSLPVTTDPTGVADFSVTLTLPVGQPFVTATATDPNNNTSPFSVQATTTTLTTAPNPSIVGQNVTFTAVVNNPGPGTPTGTVTFTIDGAAQTPATLSEVAGVNQATFSTTTLTAAAHTIGATYNGDTIFSTSTATPTTQTVQGLATTTTLDTAPNPSIAGQLVTFTAVVAPATGTGTPTGTVTFTIDGVDQTPSDLSVVGGLDQATFSTTALTAGTHTIGATYSGDTTFDTSVATPATQVVKAATTTTLTTAPNPSTFGDSVTFTVVVAPATGTGTPTGTVVFTIDGVGQPPTDLTLVGGLSEAMFSTSTLTAGAHTIGATYGGDATFGTSTATPATQTVQGLATTTTLTTAPNPSIHGDSVTFTAVVAAATGTGTPTGTVTFTIDGVAQPPSDLSDVGGVDQATFSTSALAAGAHTIGATYSGDTTFATSTATPATQTVQGLATTTSLTTAPNPSAVGELVTFTAVVAPATGTGAPTGTVTFTIDGVGQTPVNLSVVGGVDQATFSISTLTAGGHTIGATYNGDATFATSTATPATQTVQLTATTTSVTTAPNPSTVGQSVTFTAVVAPATGTGTPTGTVTFTIDGVAQTPVSLSVVGGVDQATFTTSTLTAGARSIGATYNGDLAFATSTATPATQTVQTTATTTTLTTAPNPSSVGQTVTFTAVVAPTTGTGTPTGTVTFSIDGVDQTPVNLSVVSGVNQATIQINTLTAANHTIGATYNGDAAFGTSNATPATQIVKLATTTSVTTAPNPSTGGQSVSFTATVTPATGSDLPTGTVTFTIDGVAQAPSDIAVIGGVAQAIFSTSTLTATTHSIGATYNGDATFGTSTATPATQTVQGLATTTTLTTAPNPSTAGQSVTFTAVVAPATGTGTPTGTVTFTIDGVAQTPATLSVVAGVNQATFSTSTLTATTHTIGATYNSDITFAASTATPATQTVQGLATTTTVTTAPNPSTFGQSVTFTAVVAPATGTGTPTGTVTFSIDGVNQTPSNLSVVGGVVRATFSTSTLTAVVHTIGATYNGDTTFGSSTATPATQTVQGLATTTTLTTAPNPSSAGQSVTFTAVVAQASGSGVPSGTVTFTIDGVAQTPATISVVGGVNRATFSTTTMTAGAHTIGATYNGDATFATSTATPATQTVKPATTTTLTTAPNPSTFGQTVTFTAVVAPVTGTDTPTGTVTFTIDGVTQTPSTLSVVGGVNQATFSTSTLTAGAHTIGASYSGDTTFGSSTATPATQTVQGLATTTTLTTAPNPSIFAQTVTFTATVAPTGGTGTPTGTVTFTIDGVAQTPSSLTVVGGVNQATFSTSNLSPMVHTIGATYNGDTTFGTSNAASVTQTVNVQSLVTTTTTITATPNPSSFGQTVTIQAIVLPTTGTGTPSGTVTFTIDGVGQPATALSVVNGVNQAVLTTTTIPGGTNSITATYNGDSSFAASSTTAPISQTVQPVASTTTLAATPNPSTSGQAVTLTATVSGNSASGTVTFNDGSSPLGSAAVGSNGQAVLVLSTLTPGTHAITAVYSGSASLLPSNSTAVSQVVSAVTPPPVNSAPTVVSVQRMGVHDQRTVLVLTFSTALDPTRAQNTANYRIVTQGGSGRGGSHVGHVTRVDSAIYNATTLTVTLKLHERLDVHNRYQLTVNGMAPNGLTGTTGVLLAGTGNVSGTNYVALITRHTLVVQKPAVVNRAAPGQKTPHSLQIEKVSAAAVDMLAVSAGLTARTVRGRSRHHH